MKFELLETEQYQKLLYFAEETIKATEKDIYETYEKIETKKQHESIETEIQKITAYLENLQYTITLQNQMKKRLEQ